MTPDEFLKLLEGPSVDIYVGANKVHFTLPKNLACHQCPFFQKAFDGHFKEAQEGRLEFPEEDPEYQECLRSIPADDQLQTKSYFNVHISLYVLAARFRMPKLQNETIAILAKLYVAIRNHYPIDETTIIRVYENTDAESRLRQFVCDAAVGNYLRRDMEEVLPYVDCLESVPGFTTQFLEALRIYHFFRMDHFTSVGFYDVQV
ncbi:MAG: hypothetical protein M1830_010784 [Pleopsidium flavum]|nr:MAG: hypothetical protein M1830_010784 [Pleopsidium flavum]